VKDRLHPVLQPGALLDDVRPPGYLTAQGLRALIGHPHRGQIIGRQQLRQHLSIDLVGLDLRLGDRPSLQRV
jgi:hypothetical protein